VSTIGPVAVGVVLAFAWNMTMSQPQNDTGADSVTPQVGLTVDQAAAQAWASATPRTGTAQVVTAGTQARGTAAAGTPAAGTSAAGTSAAGTPAAGTPAASSPAVADSGPWYARHARTPGDSCLRVRPPRSPDRTLQVRVAAACASALRGPRETVHPVRQIREG